MTIDRVGFIGLGAMGSRMTANLAAAGFDLVCFDAAGTEQRMPKGAAAASSARDVAAGADVILLSLPDGAASAKVAHEIAESRPRRVHTVADTSTIGVSAAKQVHERLRSAGLRYVDAPVSGGIAGAANATVALMFSGAVEDFQRLQHVLGAISKRCFHVGTEPGQGQAMKLLNNYLSAIALAATSEAISFGLTQGLDMKMMLDVLNASSGQNTATSDKFPNRIMPGLYDAKFLNTLLVKDITLYCENVAAAGTADSLGKAVLEIWRRFASAEPGADFTRIFPFVRDKR
jgi:3-hydroxyisobutyrate dehydrogenase-like beta-hydroxyacid dehydrogenase